MFIRSRQNSDNLSDRVQYTISTMEKSTDRLDIMFDDKVSASSLWTKIQLYVNTINHVLIGFITIYMSIICYRAGGALFNWHAWLCMIGVSSVFLCVLCNGKYPFTKNQQFHIIVCFVCFSRYNPPPLPVLQYQLLMTEAIMSFYSINSWSRAHTRRTKTRIHYVLMGLGALFAWSGMIVMFIFRQQTDRPHISSTHAIFGLISFIVTILGVVSGTATLWSFRLRAYLRPLMSKCLHILLGLIVFVTGTN